MPRRLARIVSFTNVVIILLFVATGILAATVIYSGLNYQLDNDESFHAQIVYLLSQGYKPYTDFLFIYTPLFHWVLLPVFWVFGFVYETFSAARSVMVVLFGVRLVFTFLLLKKVHSSLAGFLFLPITLLDAMTVFASMQIRPDTLMLAFLACGCYVLFIALETGKRWWFFVGGVLLSCAAVVMTKALPIVAVAFGIGGMYTMWKKRFGLTVFYLLGALVPVIVFASYLGETGTFWSMTQSQIDSFTIFNHLRFAPQTIFAYVPSNFYLYGLNDKPLNWYYQWVLPVLGGGGVMYLLGLSVSEKRVTSKIVLCFFLALATIVAWLSLLYIPSAFIQYHLPANWLFAACAACGLAFIVKSSQENPLRYRSMVIVLLGVYLILLRTNIQANLFRGSISLAKGKEVVVDFWKAVPPDAYVFPNLLFRKVAHPVFTGWADLPERILAQYPQPHDVLEQKQVEFVVYNSFAQEFFPEQTKEYIKNHYQETGVLDLLQRK